MIFTTVQLSKEELSLLDELLRLPQLTVPFPKAKVAAELFEKISAAHQQLKGDEKS